MQQISIQLCPKNPKPSDVEKEWCVVVKQRNSPTDKWKVKHVKAGINRFSTYKEKLRHANKTIEAIERTFEMLADPVALASSEMRFNAALDFALEKAGVKWYAGTIKAVKLAAEKLGYTNYLITKIQRKHIKLLLQECVTLHSWSNHAYNKHLGYLKAVMSRLEEWEVIEYNPAHRIKTLKVEETRKFKSYTAEEKKAIREHLYLHHYRYFIYLQVIYQTGIRPKEVLALKIKDVDLNSKTITIIPTKERSNSKTRKIRHVPISDHLHRFLKDHMEGYVNGELFVFGSPYESGKGNKGRGTKHADYFKPSMTRIKRDTVTRLWEAVVIKGLGINKYQYAAKHTGADDKILAGISLDALQAMYGHASKQMTERYITTLKGVYHKEVIDKSPDF